MSQWIGPALISGAFVIFAVFIGIAETRQENRYWDIVRRLEAAQEPAEALDSRVSVTYERMAWLEGYASCQGDVFREWLDETEAAELPKPLMPLMDPERTWREKE